MNNIQSVRNVIVRNQQAPEIENKQGNLYKVNFKAGEDRFDRQTRRQGPVYTQPAILNQQDPLAKMLEEQEKAKKKQERKSNLAWGVGIASGLAIISMVLFPFLKSTFGADSKRIKAIMENIKQIKNPNIKREAEEEMARQSYERSLYRVEDLIALDKLATTVEKRTPADVLTVKTKMDSEIIGMDEAKQPILDFLEAVNYDIKNGINSDKPIILALDGPPGTGKSSLMKTISDALGMYFKKVSLSATKNPESIIGFERTYAGATPGIMAKAQLEGNTKKVLYGLDELEKADNKVLNTFLSILDDQKIFTDKYYNSNIDLSQSMFVITTNELEKLQGTPLYNRIKPHVINIKKYSNDVKSRIAKLKLDDAIIKNKMQDSVTIASDVYDTIANMATDDGGRYTTQLVDKLITKLKVQLEHSADGKMNVSSSDVKDMLKNINLG